MAYSQAIEKAWKDIAELTSETRFSVKFISDTYDIDLAAKRVLSVSCNVCAKEYVTIILLHYLIRKLLTGALPPPSGEWMDFNELEGGEGYYPAFKKRTIDHIVKKFGDRPEDLLAAGSRMAATRVAFGDVGIVIHPFEEVSILVKMSKADEEFSPDASILFDKNVPKIFCTEDIVVMTEIIAHQL